jgi:uncharacterized MAPEG superfamily protein
MTLASWTLLIAGLLPIVCAGIAKWGSFGKPRRDGGFDNHDPREWLARQDGFRRRANNAQANSFEALPLFIAGVLVAQQVGVAQGRVDALAAAFVLLRLVYIAAYVADRPALRTAVWSAGLLTSIGLFVSAAIR